MDPDTEVVRRRLVGFRKALVIHDGAENMINDIYDCYAKEGHPGTCASYDDPKLQDKVPAGERKSKIRVQLRSKCKSRGPIGYMLESVHLQAAAIDKSFNVHQFNQPSLRTM